MLPKGNFKTDFLKYDIEEEDKLSDINIVGLTVWQSKIKTYTTNILNIKPFISYPATDVGKHDLFQQISVTISTCPVSYDRKIKK